MKWRYFLVMAVFNLALFSAFTSCGNTHKIEGIKIAIEFNPVMHSKVFAKFNQGQIELADFSASEFPTVAGKDIRDFNLKTRREDEVSDQIGKGRVYTVVGEAEGLRKQVEIVLYEEFPATAFYRVSYTNTGDSNIRIDRWVNNRYLVRAAASGKNETAFWSYQSGSYESRPDWVLPLETGFEQQNYIGMNASDYGGGTPVVDVWRKDAGIGVGHVEMTPKLVSLPVSMPDDNNAHLGVEFKVNQPLKPGETVETFRTFVKVHQGDYFQTLVAYREFMEKQGVKFDMPPETSYEPIWCAWGFERDFTIKQIYHALPKVKELGYKWAVLDDGWQTAEGDWYLTKSKFPNGDRDMIKLVDKIHGEGLAAKLWWAPLAVDPGTDLIKHHPEYLLLNEDGSKQKISWWDAYYLCPAYPPVQEYTGQLVQKIMETWRYDGLKIDGQHLNAAPPCYNKAHNHNYPEESFEKVPDFFKNIYQTAMKIKPDAVIEICPCGTAYAFHTMPFMNQSVASDPTSSWQIRLKGKTFKALMGASAPYYGDHVELSDNRNDFASTVGVGGVIGTKFTWPVGAEKDSEIDLTAAKEKKWQKWLNIYESHMLPKGRYLGTLYDIGFDRPETHAIKKGNAMYYAFYASQFEGVVELRGLDAGAEYRIEDYENKKSLP
ncbi:MAG: alpha-galactosidase, partial [Aliifodinibius sp.]|nr:alpha-galactosidase [candidate division Zixibacteria bacterium]NIT55279.1 alpha-galactosidase [Fodinibius sp.]NIS46950.1 alpha-galactosidase [candidate division Zixibacteria bacterium]NIU15097.1 alpha-galactosidase [candidate division Zixibacteria bacterium]NIV07143.1 alpha-galactosidase [candidate division Zixibacteria bacterium]